MIPVFDEPLIPPQPGPLPADAEQAARCAYLAAVTTAQHRCEAEIVSARIVYVQAERDAWITYRAASDAAVRAWLSDADDSGNRWFTPAAGSHPYAPRDH